MNNPWNPDGPSPFVPEWVPPNPNALYSLDIAAHLADVPRRSILIYCRAGLVQPVFLPPYGIMSFSEEMIHTIRRIEYVRAVYGVGVAYIKTLFDLVDEVERLRDEVRFLRGH